jgi:serine/threonine-protein kinase
VIHRDIKPANIRILENERVKVMDFGIAKVLEALSNTSTHSAGTLQYMSPEQIDATGVDPRSDLYALGLVFYELLAGRPPFESASPRELLNMHCTADPPPLPHDVRAGLPKGIERLIYALLHKRREDRPPDAEAVMRELEPFAAADGTLGPPPARTGDTVLPPAARAGNTQPVVEAAVAHARRPVEAPVAADTIGLVERAAAPRDVPAPIALVVITVLSLLAGGITYLVRTSSAPPARAEVAAPAGAEG